MTLAVTDACMGSVERFVLCKKSLTSNFRVKLITSAKDVMFLPVYVCLFVCLSVCLSVCLQDYSKSYGWTFLKF